MQSPGQFHTQKICVGTFEKVINVDAMVLEGISLPSVIRVTSSQIFRVKSLFIYFNIFQ